MDLSSSNTNLDSVQQVQVGELLEHPPISPLSLRERVRVRGLLIFWGVGLFPRG
jgi:hypothetical protein